METSQPTKRGRGRPRKIHDGDFETKERLIRHGTALLTERGFASTGLEQILREVGIPKGSFYHYFPSKDAFGLAVLENYGIYFARKLDKWLLNENRAPLDRLHDFIEDAKAGLGRFEFRRGCLVGNLGQELGSLSDEFREPLEDIFQDWQARVQTCLDIADAAGQLDNKQSTADMAACFWIGWEGAILRAKLVQSTKPVDLFAQSFFQVIKAPN